MKKVFVLFVGLFLLLTMSYGQSASDFGIKFTGFVKTDIYYDSRQSVSIRDGQFLLYPQNEYLDPNGNDINAKDNFNIISIQTRLRGNITGPDALGAKTSGAIEGEFFGHASGEINEFRLRHAYVKLDWTHTQLLVGQYWHPLFVTGCFPGTVSFNTGVPFLPFTRNPQVRLTQSFSNFKVMLTAISQRDFVSNGPNGGSTEYLRNAVIPALNLRIEYGAKYDNGQEVLFGLSGNYKSLLPRRETPQGYETTEKISSTLFMGYLKYVVPAMTFKVAAVMGEDTYNLTMLGGYAVKNVIDQETGVVDYTPYKTMSVWGDFHTNNKVWQVGLFLGYTQNQGTVDDIGGPAYARGTNIDYVYRISPRFIYNSGKFRFAPEIEYTAAAYATTDNEGNLNIDTKCKVTDSKVVGMVRFLIGVYYFF